MKFMHIVIGMTLVLGNAVVPLQAEPVKKWVDENGVTHYSYEPPHSSDVLVEEIDLADPPPPSPDTRSTTERLRQQAEELERARKQREQAAEQEELDRALEEAQQREELVPVEKKKKKSRGPYFYPPRPFPRAPKDRIGPPSSPGDGSSPPGGGASPPGDGSSSPGGGSTPSGIGGSSS